MTSNLGRFSSKNHGLGEGRPGTAEIAGEIAAAQKLFLASIRDDASLHFSYVN
jgi:hypothetical protein